MSVKFEELRGDLTYAVPVAATAAGTAVEVPIVRLPFAAQITEILWVPGAAIVANVTNYFTLSVRNRQAAAGTVVMGSRAYSSVNGVATTPEVVTLSGTAADLQPASGDVLTAHFTHTGTGLAIPAGLVQVKLRIR